MNVLKREWERLRSSPMARNAGWMMAGQGTGVLLQAAYFVFLARLLGASEYGIFAGAFAFSSLVAQYSPLGTGTLFIRYVSADRKAFSTYWGNVLLVTLSVGGVLTLVLHVLGRYLLNPRSAALVILAGIGNCVCAQLTIEAGRVFQTFEKMRITAILNLLTNLVRTLAAGLMLLLIHRTTAWNWAIVSTFVSAVAALASAVTASACFGRPRIRLPLFLEHVFEGLGYSFASSTAAAYNDLDKTMLSHYGMNLANGIYTMAYRVVDIATIPVFAIRDAAVPKLFQRGQSGLGSAAELSNRLLKRTLPVSMVLAFGMFVVAPLIPRVVGHGFVETVAALRWLCLIPVFRCIHQMTGCALTGAGLQTYRTLAQATAAAFNFGLNLLLIPHYGWVGAAWSSLATDATLGAINWAILRILT